MANHAAPGAATLRERFHALPAVQARALTAAGFLALALALMTVSVALAPPGAKVAAWWPAAGVSAAAVLWARGRLRWAMAGGVFAVSLAGNVLGGRSLGVSAGFAVANTAEAVTVALLVLRAGGSRAALATMSGLFNLVRACAAGAVVAAVGAGLTVWRVEDASGWAAARAVGPSHLAALLVVLPCFLAAGSSPRRPAAERVGQWFAVVVVTVVVFAPAQSLPLAFLPFVPLMWGAVRMGQRTVHLQIVVTGVLTSVLTSRGGGPAGHLATQSPTLAISLVQVFLVCSALMVMPLSVAIRQRQDTTHELVRSEALFRHGFNEALVGMLLLHRDGDELRIVEINPVALRLLTGADGRTESDLVGEDWTHMVSPRSVEDTISLAGFLDSDSAPGWQGELRVEAPDGAWLEVALSPLTEYASDLYTAQLADVTERLAAEAQLRSSLDAERRAVEQLTELDRAKDDFVTNVSHELRTPITSVIGYAELLATGEVGSLDPVQHGMVTKVQRNAERLLGLIEDVLAVSRMDAGSFTFHMDEVDVRACAWQACETLERQAADRSVRLAVATPRGALHVTGDRSQLERALINLMSNAIKFTPPQGEVTVRLHVEDNFVVVDVEDSGMGVPEEEAHRLFERFFRSSNAQAAAVQGTGLGLTIVSSIAQAHGGRVDYRPRTGGGSVFSLTLPLSQSVREVTEGDAPAEVVAPDEVEAQAEVVAPVEVEAQAEAVAPVEVLAPAVPASPATSAIPAGLGEGFRLQLDVVTLDEATFDESTFDEGTFDEGELDADLDAELAAGADERLVAAVEAWEAIRNRGPEAGAFLDGLGTAAPPNP
jgi:two-component system, OmpR family, phosphate regulon sensor histidine kinase PhoR